MDIREPIPANRDAQRGLIDAAMRQVEDVGSSMPPSLGAAPSYEPRIPGYRFHGEKHRGGQGVVYRAFQESTQRTVAIKLLRRGPLATEQDVIRFEREVRTLARLQHPNIVAIHDSGAIDGCYYYVMNYVDGMPLDKFVNVTAPNPRAIARLFVEICDAVNAAHLHGVIHRDLKPGNIRVDRDGRPHVLDFGLSKTAEEDDGSSAMTLTGEFVGSIPWAAPEQAAGRMADIDIRTDVYALGVMLYQMLAGQLPYGRERLSGPALLDAIQNMDPLPLRPLRRDVDHELDTIVRHCLQKDPTRRYQSAGDLGRDLQRYLAGDAIAAKRDSAAYLLRKQIRRHWMLATVAGGIGLLVTVGFFVSLAFWRLAERETARAESEATKAMGYLADAQDEAARALSFSQQAQDQATRAATEAAKARAVNEMLRDMLTSVNPDEGNGRDARVVDLLDPTAARLDEGNLADRPEVEAAVRWAIGGAYASLGLYPEAEQQFGASLDRLKGIDEPNPTDLLQAYKEYGRILRENLKVDEAEAVFREGLALCDEEAANVTCLQLRLGIANCFKGRGDYAESERLYREAIPPLEAVLGRSHADVATELTNLAQVLRELGKTDEAERLLREAVDIYQSTKGPGHTHTASTIANLSALLLSLGRFEEAESLALDSIATLREKHGDRHPRLATALASLGSLYVREGKLAEGEQALREALKIRVELFGEGDARVAEGYNNLAVLLYQLGRFAEAEEHMEKCVEAMRRVHGDRHPRVAHTLANLGTIRLYRGNRTAGRAALEEAADIQKELLGAAHPDRISTLRNISMSHRLDGELETAEQVLREILSLQRGDPDTAGDELALTLDNLGGVLQDAKRYEEAEALLTEALETRKRVFGPVHASVALSLNNVATIKRLRNEFAAAEEYSRMATEMATQALPTGHWQPEQFRANWGLTLILIDRFEDGEQQLLQAYEAIAKTRGADDQHSKRIAGQLAQAYRRIKDTDAAQHWSALAGETTSSTPAPAGNQE